MGYVASRGNRLHDPGDFFEFFLEARQGEVHLLDARGGVARLDAADAVAMLGEECGEEFGGLERVDCGLAQLVAERLEFVLSEFLEVDHAQ
jgi:hypothetical protein